MITIRAKQYTQNEREIIPPLFSSLEFAICQNCMRSLTCSEFANKDCEYKHLLYDIECVKLGYPVAQK